MSEQRPMTACEFFDEAARLKLRAPMSHEDMCAAFDAKDAEIAELRAALSRLQAGGGEPSDSFKRECDDADELMRLLGLEPEHCRTDGGAINMLKVRAKTWGRVPAAPAKVLVPLSKAAQDVIAERGRQISAKGWTPKHDDKHHDGSMALAAACYACNAATWADRPMSIKQEDYARLANPGFRWPWAAKWWKPKSQRQDLIKAGALIIAEIERLDRATHNGLTLGTVGNDGEKQG